MDRQAKDRFRQAKLTPRETLCLALMHYDGLPTRSIASRLQIPRATVGRAITAARGKLQAARLKLRPLTVEPEPLVFLGRDRGEIGPSEIKARW